jgi:hypothetical protein
MADYYGVDSLGNIIDESLYDDIPVEGFTDPSKRFVDMTDDEKIEYVAPLLKQHQMYNNAYYSPYRDNRRSTINTVDDGNQFYYNNYLRGSYIPEGYQQGMTPDGYPIPPGVTNQVRYSGADNPRQIDQYFRNAAGLDQPGITPNMTLNAPPEAHMDMRRIMGQPIFPVPPQQPYPSEIRGRPNVYYDGSERPNVSGRPDIYGRPSFNELGLAVGGRPSVYYNEKRGGLLDIIANIKKSIFD